MDSASTSSSSGNQQTASLHRAQVSKKPSINKKPVPTASQTSNGRLAAFKKLVRRSIRTLNQKNSNKYHRNCQRTRYSLEQQLQAISQRTKTQEQKFKQHTVVLTCTKTPGKMSGEQSARNVPTTTGPTVSHIPRLFAPTVGTPKTCVKPQLDAKKLTLTDTKAVKSTTSLTAKSIKSNLMSKFSTPTTNAKSAGGFGSTKVPSSAAPVVSTTPSIRKNIFTKTPLTSRLPVTPSTTSRIAKPDTKTPATRQPPAVVALNDKKLSRTVDCARTIKRRSVNYLKKNESIKTPGRIPVRTGKQYPQTEIKKNVPRVVGTKDVNETPSGKSTGKRLSLSNFKSHCLILTPSLMQHLFKSAAKSTSKGSQKAPTVVEEEEDEELIQVHSIKPTSLLKFILSEKTDGETVSTTTPVQETDTSSNHNQDKLESDKLDDTIVIQNETEPEQPASIQMFVPDTQDQVPKQDLIISDSLPDIIEDSVPYNEQAIDIEPIPSAQVTEQVYLEGEHHVQQDEQSPVEIQMDILTQTENSINEEVETVSTPKTEDIVEIVNSESQQETIPETNQQDEFVQEEIKKTEEPETEEKLVEEETNLVEEEKTAEPTLESVPEPIVEEKSEEVVVSVAETVPEQVIQEKQAEEIVQVEQAEENPAVVNIETELENQKENDALWDQEKSSQTDFDDSIEIQSNYENDSQMEHQQAPITDFVDTAQVPIEPIVESVQQNEDLDSTIQEQVQPEATVDEPKQPVENSPAKQVEPDVQPEIEKEEKEPVNEIVEEEHEDEKPKGGKKGGRAKKATTRGRAKKAEVQVEEEENKENAESGPVESENIEKPKRGRRAKKVEEVETCCKLATVEETAGRVLTRAQRAKLNQK